MKSIIVPIDNRPVTYMFPQMIGAIAGVQTMAPPREMMGSLTVNTSVENLSAWLNETITNEKPDALVVCLDSVIYGGLIPSRRIEASVDEIISRTKPIKDWKKLGKRDALSVYAQSSIMRISDNYDNVEEKTYWSEFGREIFAWSANLHHLASAGLPSAFDSNVTTGDAHEEYRAAISDLESRIDERVRQDYLRTRLRNFQVNRALLDFVEAKAIDHLVFSQDDSGEFGLNVLERDKLVSEAAQRGLKNVVAYPGADEVIMSMFGRWLISKSAAAPRAAVKFSPQSGASIASRYEGQTIGESVTRQLAAIGIERIEQVDDTRQGGMDFNIVIHTSGSEQGDHIWLPGHPDTRFLSTEAAVADTIGAIKSSAGPVILCDVAYANGADPILTDALLARPELLSRLWGYAGWNTTGNTLGSALATGVARWFGAKTRFELAQERLKQALFVRLADDWAYQAQVRKQLDGDLSLPRLSGMMAPYLQRIASALGMVPPATDIKLPWHRSFEVEIDISGN